VFAGCVAGS